MTLHDLWRGIVLPVAVGDHAAVVVSRTVTDKGTIGSVGSPADTGLYLSAPGGRPPDRYHSALLAQP